MYTIEMMIMPGYRCGIHTEVQLTLHTYMYMDGRVLDPVLYVGAVQEEHQP